MSKDIKIRRGLDIRLVGDAEKVVTNAPQPDVIAIKPTDFPGLIPKMLVKQGEKVKAGTPVFADKYNTEVLYSSPVSGEVAEIVRGAKRRILEVRILADKETTYEQISVSDASKEDVIKGLLASGAWANLRQRPFEVVANPADTPKAIFISAFDSSPLAPDLDFVVNGQEADFQKGLDVVAKLTEGKVHLTLKKNYSNSGAFKNANNVQINTISGPHPAGNVGTQVHFIDPVNKGELVWHLDVQAVITIGKLFSKGVYDASKIVAVTGSEAAKPKYYKTVLGAQLKSIVEGVKSENVRYVSGNPLTGDKVGLDGFLGYYHQQITILPEGDEPKLSFTKGWLSPGFGRFSASKLYPSWLTPNKKYTLDTNYNGEHRSFVVTGEMEKVMPMDILPMHLVKSMMYNDIDEMEQLGIYEVAPEDFALCEFVNTSKINIQDVVREALDTVKRETT